MVSKMKEKKIRNIIVIAAALVVSAILSVAFIKLARQQHVQSLYAKQMDLGSRYLAEQNYQEAIIAFGKAIEIDPKQAEAYLKLGEAYSGIDEYEKAEAILAQGYDITKDERIAKLQARFESKRQMIKPTEENLPEVTEEIMTKGEDNVVIDEDAIYKGILDKYYLAVSQHWNRQLLSDEGLCDLCSYYEGLSQIGYAFIDLDGNGVRELLIGETGADGDKGMFFDLYTIMDEEAVPIVKSGERNRYYVCADYKIANEGSGGAQVSTNAFYAFDGEKGNLSFLEAVIYDGEHDEANPWFYTTKEPKRENYTPIAEEQALQLQFQYTHQDISFTPLAEYSYSCEIEQRQTDIMIEAVAPIVDFSSYREQKMITAEFDDTDIHDLVEWHMATEGYDDGPDNKPIFDIYEYGEYGRKWFNEDDVYKKIEDLYGTKVNRDRIRQDTIFEFQDDQISMPGGDGEEWLTSVLLECRTEDEHVILRIRYKIEYNVPELNTEETVVATFLKNPDSYIGYTLVKVESME